RLSPSLGCRVVRTASPQNVLRRLIPFVAGVLIDHVFGIAGQRDGYFPGPGVDVGIVDRNFVLDGARISASESLDHVQSLALRDALDSSGGSAGGDPSLAVEIGSVDDKGVAVPVASRIAVPEPNGRRRMSTPGISV